MLSLQNITKIYRSGDITVRALSGVTIEFRKSEFVAVLGPSGGGKTTLLNIIGGLDQYTDGDLSVNGRSTRDFRDRDWDAYRNHSVGFVFQSYNLIPHQTVLQNVELALTLSGVSKTQRRQRARGALEQVGLGDQLHKRPSEMSGGQMQRVAIARAIVNDPEIILADEPTGALDTETSLQVMDILKEIAKDRLVIMVTHNPELAERYATRIVRILDGRIIADSRPLDAQETAREAQRAQAAEQARRERGRREKKPSMSVWTSFGLSLKNLFTKKGRTVLTAFAGSIGIIGIALIYAVSQGMTTYIDKVQEDTLSSYPLTLEAQHVDMSSLLTTFMGKAASTSEHENDAVYQKAMIYNLVNSLSTLQEQKNDLAAFKKYLEKACEKSREEGLGAAVSGVQYSYGLQPLIYTTGAENEIIQSDTQELMQELVLRYMGMDLSGMMKMSQSMGVSSAGGSAMSPSAQLWQEMLSGEDGSLVSPLLKQQYDVVYGSWPDSYDEVVLVVDEHNELDDLTLYALGLKSREDVEKIMQAAADKTELSYEGKSWSYAEICNRDFRTVLGADCFVYDEKTGCYTDLRESAAGLNYLYDNALRLRVSGIIRPNRDAVATMLSGSIGYTRELTEYVVKRAEQSPAVQAQRQDSGRDIFTGLPFSDSKGQLTEEKKAADFRKHIAALQPREKAQAYLQIQSIPEQSQVEQYVAKTLGSMDRAQMEKMALQGSAEQLQMSPEKLETYLASMSDEALKKLLSEAVAQQYSRQYAAAVQQRLSSASEQQLSAALTAAAAGYTDAQCARYYDEVLTFSDSSLEKNLLLLGAVDLDTPTAISIYASTFADKDVIKDAISAYNETADELSEIHYTDYVGLMMSSVTTIINAITYVLIAFVAVSLIVSSIMIGVITLISVQERTKEIGILRAIGASKRNVSSMFNAETVLIGLAAGGLGVLITYLLCIPINLILHRLTGIRNLSAVLPLPAALVLVIVSIALTLLAGLIPSRSAAKKDPVVALRTE